MAVDHPQPAPATLTEALAQLGASLNTVASELRELLARSSLFDGADYAHWQLLSVLNSLGLHESTVAQLCRVVGRRAVDVRCEHRGTAR